MTLVKSRRNKIMRVTWILNTPFTSRLRQDNTQDGPESRVARTHTTIEMDLMPNTHTCTHLSAPKQICEANEIQE